MSTPLGHDRGIRRAIATLCLSGMLEDKLDAVAGAGFDGVEIFENDLIASSSTPAEVRKRCADLGLSIDLYQPFRDFDTVLPDRLTANLRWAEHKFAVMEELGTDTMLVCSAVAGDALDDPARIADQFHELAERASRRGMRIAYEAGFVQQDPRITLLRRLCACSSRWSSASARIVRTGRRIRRSRTAAQRCERENRLT